MVGSQAAAALELLAQTESIFALANGHIGLRGNLDEGEPPAIPGTYLNGYYEIRPLPSAEAAYGDPKPGQTMLNVTNGKLIRLLVDDEPFDLRYGQLLRHERVLDLRDCVLRREVEWASPAGQRIRLRSTRLVSFVQGSVPFARADHNPSLLHDDIAGLPSQHRRVGRQHPSARPVVATSAATSRSSDTSVSSGLPDESDVLARHGRI